MLKVQEIREIIKLMDQSSIDEIEYEFQGTRLQLKKNGGAVSSPVNAPAVKAEAQQPAPQPVAVQPQVVQEPAPQPEVKQEVAQPKVEENLVEIKSPMVGTFYQASSPDAEPFVKIGSKVSSSTVVCIVEAMKLFNEIEAEVNGEIAEILVKDGELVEYGQPLFRVKPE
ncbi:acetyl-CoA carboxylase biotin carboxyl carrier protein [Streptomyces gulbargensis]|uniref:Biotin carboxyl carrier protein of acetyl-CoA carboxylase n=2 Tax=Bacillati TaxID=1783272 RepID=A0ABP7NHT5_9ACTN